MVALVERSKQMLKPSMPYGTRYGFTTRRHLQAFLTQEPRVLPALPRPKRLSRGQRVLAGLLWLCLAPLLLLGFLVLGQRPTLHH